MALHEVVVVSDLLQLVEEPAVNLGQLVQFVNAVTCSQRRPQHKDTPVCRITQLLKTNMQYYS